MTDLMKHMTFFKNNEIACKIRPKQKRGHLWKLYKKILQPQMRIQDMAFISVKLKPYSRVLIVEGFAYNNFVANLAKKVKNGNIVYMEMFPKCMRTKKLLKTYKNVQHICAPPHVMRHIGKPSLWKDYRDLYESKLSPLAENSLSQKNNRAGNANFNWARWFRRGRLPPLACTL